MNQILSTPHKNYLYKYIFLFVFSSLIFAFSTIYILFSFYKKNKQNNISNTILQPYTISKLYSSINASYEETVYPNSPFIIGTIEIPSLSIELPILSQIDDNLLKVSVCRFYGPMPNEIGNLCIAGHNYNNGSFFSNIPNLSIGDIIIIKDLYNKEFSYTVYDKYEINAKDTNCTSQETNGQKEITLVTCNNFTGNRIIIKAK